MKDLDDGGPAFPSVSNLVEQDGFDVPSKSGMSLRDWFAGQALAVFANDKTIVDLRDVASDCYTMADAMLEARKK